MNVLVDALAMWLTYLQTGILLPTRLCYLHRNQYAPMSESVVIYA